MDDYYRLALNKLDEEADRQRGEDIFNEQMAEHVKKRLPAILAQNPEYTKEDAEQEAEEEFKSQQSRALEECLADLAQERSENENYGGI